MATGYVKHTMYIVFREAAKKKRFFLDIFPKCGWVGWLIPKQGPNPSNPPQIAPKIALFDPNFTFRFPKSYKNPGVGGWVNRFGKGFPKKNVFFWQLPLWRKHNEQCTQEILFFNR